MTIHMLSQTSRASRSRHTGRPILEELNTHYGYWATARILTEDEYAKYRGMPVYDGPIHEVEEDV